MKKTSAPPRTRRHVILAARFDDASHVQRPHSLCIQRYLNAPHSSQVYSQLLSFDGRSATCLPPRSRVMGRWGWEGQGPTVKMQLVKLGPPRRHGFDSACSWLMPAVSSHYLIGIEMHLDCVFVCAALLVAGPSPPLSRTPNAYRPTGRGFVSCVVK